MNSIEWVFIQLILLMSGFVVFVVFMVVAPLVLISANINAARKKKQEQSNGTTAPPSSNTPAAVVSQEDGRVIAMESPDPQPVAPATVRPQKDGFRPLQDFVLPVLGKLVVTLVTSQFKHRHHK